MHHIWSPWRMEYIQQAERASECFFCRALKDDNDLEHLVVFRGTAAFAILNRYPYTTGHLMVVPFDHLDSLEALTPAVRMEMLELVTESLKVLRKIYHPEAFNIGANIGEAAGAGVAGHIHFHVVPRWTGDTNFMSTLGETRVLPENLQDTCLRVLQAWSSLHPPTS